MKLYEIADAQRRFFDQVIDNDGVITPELEAEGNAISSDLKSKARDCIAYYQEIQRQIDAIKHEQARLSDFRSSVEHTLNTFESYLLRCLGPESKIETSLGKLSFRGSNSTEVYDESIVPEEYWTTPTPKPHIDRARILREAANIPGVNIVKNYSLQIK